ncbi:MAG TPA: CHAD domain-containing protein, partial [Stellaceae bacterium]|nr:CHAD domain-containing protein [Stellaceae bacterium]
QQRLQVADELRWLARSLGRARNLDVFASELLPAARAGLSEEPGWDDLAAKLDGLRRNAYAQIKEMLLSERYTATMLRLLRWFESSEWREHQDLAGADLIDAPIGNIAPHLLDRLRRRVQKRSKRFRRLTAPERHRLRIAAKKLRYTLELFGDIACGPNSPAFVHRLKQLQDGLGYANDIRAAHQFAPELFLNCDSRSSAVHAWISLLLWHDHALIKSERRLIKRVRRLRRLAL